MLTKNINEFSTERKCIDKKKKKIWVDYMFIWHDKGCTEVYEK